MYKSKTFNQIFITGMSGIVIISTVVILNGLIARNYGIDSLGEYLLIKRVASALVPLSLFGVAIGIPRNMGIVKSDVVEQKRIITAGVQLFFRFGIIIILMVGLIFLVFPTLLGDNITVNNTIIPFVIISAALALHQLSFAFYRGKLKMGWANLLQLLNVGLIPLLLVVLIKIETVGQLLLWHGLFTLSISIIVLTPPVSAVWIGKTSKNQMKNVQHNLLSYSIRRIGAVIGMVTLLIVGPLLMARYTSKEELAFFSIGFQINRMFYSLFGPIGIVLLPQFAYQVSKGSLNNVNKGLSMIFQASISVGLYAFFHLWYFSKLILNLWLGYISNEGILIFRLFTLSILFYLWFENSRNPIDAFTEKGYNSRNLLISIFMLVSITLILNTIFHLQPSYSITVGYVFSYFVLGILSLLTCKNLYHFKIFNTKGTFYLFVLNIIIIVGIEWFVKSSIISQINFIQLALIEAIAFSLYLMGLYLLKHSWLFFIINRLRFQES